jgi:putative exporter of polyketide antibiotics
MLTTSQRSQRTAVVTAVAVAVVVVMVVVVDGRCDRKQLMVEMVCAINTPSQE